MKGVKQSCDCRRCGFMMEKVEGESHCQAPAPMAFPMTTPQVPVYGMVPPQMGQMGGVPVMAPQPMMYNQPVLRPTNPFAPMPGAQMQFM